MRWSRRHAITADRLGRAEPSRQTASMTACPTCGRQLEEHNKHVRFRLPDPVLSTDGWERLDGTWVSESDPNSAVMMQVPNLGGFVRCLLPVRLTGGHTVTFGVWLGVQADNLRRAFEAWWSPAYADLHLSGRLANALPGWGLLGARAEVTVRDPEATPYVSASDDRALASVLADEWPHESVLAGLP